MNLIKIENRAGQLKTDSLNVAEVFEKRHDHVIRDIEELDCSADFREPNFGLSFYNRDIDGFDRKYKKYEITKDGLVFLIMGYSGNKAAEMKEAYIKRFNEMKEALLKPSPMIPDFNDPVESARAWADAKESELIATAALKEAQPAIEFEAKVKADADSITVSGLAKLATKNGYNIGRNRLFKWLKDNKYLISSSEPYQKYMNQQLFEIEPIENDGFVYNQVLVTGKGQTYFMKRLGNLPAVDNIQLRVV